MAGADRGEVVMRWRLLLSASSVLLVVLVLASATPTLALVSGPLDGGAHPSVGHLFAQISDPGMCSAEVFAGCSATLISSTVAVTSGGCAEVLINAADYGYDLTAIWISFNGNDPFDCATASRVQSLHFHPGFDETDPGSPTDIGVVVLAAPATATRANLPAAGSQGANFRGDPLDSVGWAQDDNGNVFTYRRRVGPVDFRATAPEYLFTHLVLKGNTCATGLDGGGLFLPGSQNLAGLDNSAGNGCKNGTFLRLDSAAARDFLEDFVALP